MTSSEHPPASYSGAAWNEAEAALTTNSLTPEIQDPF